MVPVLGILFLQTYSNQGLKVELEDMQEFYDLVKTNANKIKESFKQKEA